MCRSKLDSGFGRGARLPRLSIETGTESCGPLSKFARYARAYIYSEVQRAPLVRKGLSVPTLIYFLLFPNSQAQTIMSIYFLTTTILNPELSSASGGMISNLRMIENMADWYQVVCVPMTLAGFPDVLGKNKSVVIDPPKAAGRGRFRYALEHYVRYRQRVERAIERHGAGIIIATRAAIPLAHQVSSRFGLPFIIVTRAFEDLEQAALREPYERATIFRKMEGAWQRKKIIKAYRGASYIVTNSEYMKHEVERLFGTASRFTTLYPPMDIAMSRPNIGSIKKIGFINKGARKGLDLVRQLARRLPDKQFLVFGEPMDVRRGQEAKNVVNMGYQNDRLMMFGSADLFLVPSTWDEPYGRVAAEAIWRGKPVVVSKKGGLPEAAPNELFWEDSFNVEAWAKKIDWMAQSEHRSALTDAVKRGQDIIELAEQNSLAAFHGVLAELLQTP